MCLEPERSASGPELMMAISALALCIEITIISVLGKGSVYAISNSEPFAEAPVF